MPSFETGGLQPEQTGAKQKAESAKDYREQATVNDIKINVGWSRSYDEYAIYFPQIEVTEDARRKEVNDQVILISKQPELAKKVFDYASQVAETENDIYEIYKKVQAYSQDLVGDKE